jgi:ABC-type siderophore export system fused ATPase/permease subunit
MYINLAFYLFEQWGDSEDRLALVGLGFAAIVALWASANVITVIARTIAFLHYSLINKSVTFWRDLLKKKKKS